MKTLFNFQLHRSIFISLEFKLEDFWIGLFWRNSKAKTDNGPKTMCIEIWICLFPCLPIHIQIWRSIFVGML